MPVITTLGNEAGGQQVSESKEHTSAKVAKLQRHREIKSRYIAMAFKITAIHTCSFWGLSEHTSKRAVATVTLRCLTVRKRTQREPSGRQFQPKALCSGFCKSLIFVCVHLQVYSSTFKHVHVGAQTGQKAASDTLDLEIQEAVSYHIQGLETKLGSSAKAACARSL